ncbi:MAG: hypothetical protein B7733_14425 [Myxococcales bacterium FL481]|nr:MAG: hypothetical protein B7733_14425 [Myxococcales bacterium FL481]
MAASSSASGIYLPAALVQGSQSLWTLRPELAWQAALHRHVSLGGASASAIYQTSNARLRVHDHAIAMATSPGRGGLDPRHADRLAVAFSTHRLVLLRIREDGTWQDFHVGGVRDTIVRLSYGMEHQTSPRIRVAWQVRPGFAWVFLSTQRLLQVATRVSFHPRPTHEIALLITGHGVHRDRRQFGSHDIPRASLHGEVGLTWSWLSSRGVGLRVSGRALSSFLSGEAPLYEVREETLRTPYAEASAGLLLAW